MEFLSEIRGRDFEKWKPGTCGFIDAPTGSGKTTYILEQVLPYMAANNKRILYMVNRSILKKQLERELLKKDPRQQACIKVMTYQSLEKEIICNQIETWNDSYMKKYAVYDCVVCDECHYFLADSTYNAQNYWSFIWILENFYNRIQIYMSATIVEVKFYLQSIT